MFSKSTKITEVNVSTLVYRLFHEDFSPIIGTSVIFVYKALHCMSTVYIEHCEHCVIPEQYIYLLGKGGYVFGSVG